jgi:hypothetical protein
MDHSTISVQGQKPPYTDLTFAHMIKIQLLEMDRDNDTLLIYILNVKKLQHN